MPPSGSLTLKRRKKKQRQKQRRQSEAQTAAGGWGSHRSSSSDGESDSQGGAAVGVPLAPGVAHAAGILKLDQRVLRLNDLGFDEEELGFTADDLDAALRVVQALGKDTAAFRSQPFKELRTAMHPIIEEQLKHYGVKGGALKRKRNQRDVAEITSLKEQDKEWVNRAALRAKRLAQLEELNKAAPVMGNGQPLLLTHMGEVEEAVMQIKMHRVADGAVDLEEEEVEEAAKQGAGRRLNIPINCYTCKRPFRDLHFFYDQLCPACAALNYQKRNETVDLTGRVALVTGARVKIGYRIALKLLRCGATVIATSRFAADCARRYAAQKG
jgi:3-oxoacyl-ACP reductase-like protein